MSDTIKVVEDTLDIEDRRRQSAVSTAQVAQSTRLRPKLLKMEQNIPSNRSIFLFLHRM